MDDYKWRKEKAELLKAKFNVLWDDALNAGQGVMSYRDMVRIADVIRFDAAEYLEGKPLPTVIDAGLEAAIAVVNPDKIAQKKEIKNLLALAGGLGGVAVIIAGLIPMLRPSLIARIWTKIAGGIAGGIENPIKLITGSGICLTAIYKMCQTKSPNSRAALCHEIVQTSINKWVKESARAIQEKTAAAS